MNNSITLDNNTLSFLAQKAEESLGSKALEECTEEQFAAYKQRGLENWKASQQPKHPFTIEVQGMRASIKINQVFLPENFKKAMGRSWAKVYEKYPVGKFSHQVIINDHADNTSEVKLVVLPLMTDEMKQDEVKIALGYRDFDSVDREFDIIQNTESFKFSSAEVFGLSIDQSRNEEEDYDLSEREEEEIMANLDMEFIPEESDGFLRQLINLRDDLRIKIEDQAPKWE